MAKPTPTQPQTSVVISEEDTQIVRQMIADHLNSMPPGARAVMTQFCNRVMPNLVVLTAAP